MVLGMVGVLVGCSKLTKMNDGYFRCSIEHEDGLVKADVNGENVDLYTTSIDDFTFEDKEELEGLKALLENSKQGYDEFCEGFKESCIENYDYVEHIMDDSTIYIPFYTQRKARLITNTEETISLLYEVSGYWGGAHGFSFYDIINYSPVTGNRILFEDVIDTSVEDWENKLTEIVYNICEQRTVEGEKISYFENYKNDLSTEFNDDWFYLTDDAIVFVYGEYGITPYSEGIQEVEVPFSEIQELLKDTYKIAK